MYISVTFSLCLFYNLFKYPDFCFAFIAALISHLGLKLLLLAIAEDSSGKDFIYSSGEASNIPFNE